MLVSSGFLQNPLGVDVDFRPQRKAHPAFVVDEIDSLSDRLGESGYDVVWDDAIPGSRRFFSADPFGNRIECLENPIGPTPPQSTGPESA